jgi:hypothetical protein
MGVIRAAHGASLAGMPLVSLYVPAVAVCPLRASVRA